MKSIETHACTFFPLNISAIGSVTALRSTQLLNDPQGCVTQFACLAFKSKKHYFFSSSSSFLTISNQKTAFFDLKGRKSCQLCPGAFTSDLAYFYHHFRSHRPKSEILDCKVCGKTAKNMMMFKRHVLGWDFSNKLTAIPPVDLYLIFE